MKKRPSPLKPLTQEQILGNWVTDKILVSIICPTFNHETYIEDALYGFLGQITRFPFEIIIRDDASTDKTADIIKRYADQYPKLIKPIIEPINNFPMIQPGPVLRAAAEGKFIAYCEGDDYWIDPLKLQKQVDFLENNPNVSLLETNSVAIEKEHIIEWPGSGGTRTYMHSSSINIPSQYYQYIHFGDTYIRAIMQSNGKIAKLDDVTAVWRKHEQGIFGSIQAQSNTAELNFKRATTNFWISLYLQENNHSHDSFHYFKASIRQLIQAYPNKNYSNNLKLASYIIAQPLINLLVSTKEKLKSKI